MVSPSGVKRSTRRDTTSLYRLFSSDGKLLYIGIAGNPGRRFEQHRDEKLWWSDVAKITLEHHDSRDAALLAERDGIIREKPLHNVVHNRTEAEWPPKPVGPDRWIIVNHHGHTRRSDLWLYPEIDLSSRIDEIYWASGEEQVEHFLLRVRRDLPEAWERDELRIGWLVLPIQEMAPFQIATPDSPDLLKKGYQWPVHATTGAPVDWYQLDVRMNRYPKFTAALRYTPAPLQRTFPVRSFWESRFGD